MFGKHYLNPLLKNFKNGNFVYCNNLACIIRYLFSFYIIFIFLRKYEMTWLPLETIKRVFIFLNTPAKDMSLLSPLCLSLLQLHTVSWLLLVQAHEILKTIHSTKELIQPIQIWLLGANVSKVVGTFIKLSKVSSHLRDMDSPKVDNNKTNHLSYTVGTASIKNFILKTPQGLI